MTVPPTHPVDVLLILTDRDRVLLALREGTGYADGQWNLPSGKLEAGEDATSAVIREANEEIGVRLTADETRLVSTVHYRTKAGHGRIGLVYAAAHDPARHGEVVNAEPHKCAGIGWFTPDELPPETYFYSVECVAAWQAGDILRLSGWPPAAGVAGPGVEPGGPPL